jgi:hypothetical protein
MSSAGVATNMEMDMLLATEDDIEEGETTTSSRGGASSRRYAVFALIFGAAALVCFAMAASADDSSGRSRRSLTDSDIAYYICKPSFIQKPKGATMILSSGQCPPCSNNPAGTACAVFAGAYDAYEGGMPATTTLKQFGSKWADKLNPLDAAKSMKESVMSGTSSFSNPFK